jgi:hypothetical protein
MAIFVIVFFMNQLDRKDFCPCCNNPLPGNPNLPFANPLLPRHDNQILARHPPALITLHPSLQKTPANLMTKKGISAILPLTSPWHIVLHKKSNE